MMGRNPTRVTVAVAVEYDATPILSDTGGGAKGIFLSLEPTSEGGGISVGTLTTNKTGIGLDADVSIAGTLLAGGSNDLQGGSTSGEVDIPLATNILGRAGVTLEGGG